MRPDAMPVASEEIAPTHVEHGAHSSPSGSPHQRCTKYPAVVREPGGPGCGVSGGPVPGIGPSSAAKILDQVEAEPHATEVLYDIRVPKVAAQDWPAFAKLVEQMRQGKTTWPGELELVQEWYAPHLDRIHNDAPFRAADVAQLGQIAAGYGSRERPLSPRHTIDSAAEPSIIVSAAECTGRNLVHFRIGHLRGGNGWGLPVLLEVLGHCRSRDRAN
jgi:hypothetical protein